MVDDNLLTELESDVSELAQDFAKFNSRLLEISSKVDQFDAAMIEITRCQASLTEIRLMLEKRSEI